LFAVSQSGDGELKLAVAVGKKVTLLRWKHPVVWSTWSVGSNKDVADGFETIKVQCQNLRSKLHHHRSRYSCNLSDQD